MTARLTLTSTLVAVPLLALAAGCASAPKATTPKATAPNRPPSSSQAASPPAATDACGPIPLFTRARFPATPRVDNRWAPLTPGTRATLDGTVTGQDGRHTHRIVTTVTDLTKTVDGVPAVVVLDDDLQDGELQESEIYFIAQDTAGAEWLLGEFPGEYDNGKFSGAPSAWIGGTAGSVPGTALPASPVPGSPGYRQGSAPAVQFLDCARVYATGQRTTVPNGSYTNVMVTDEWGPLAPEDGHQRKFYAPGIGVVRVAAVGGNSREDLVLTRLERLCGPGDLGRARAEALALDHKAYQTLGQIYDQTSPARQTLRATGCGT
jgi:hypothetical protein